MLRHLTAVDQWLAEMEREPGPVPDNTVKWTARVVDEWESGVDDPSHTARRAS